MTALTVVQILPALEAGGVERGTIEIARALKLAGHRAIVVSARGRLTAELEACGAEHVALPIGAKRPATLGLIATLRERLSRWRADIVHARSRLPAWVAWYALGGMPDPMRPAFVTTVHGPYSVNAYSAIMTRGRAVIAISEFIADYIRAGYPRVDPARLWVIPRGIDHTAYPHALRPASDWLSQWQHDIEPAARFVVTQVARLTRWKGQLDFIAVIAELKARGVPVLGVIVGGPAPGRDRYRAEIERAIAARNLGASVRLLGDRADVREILAVSDASVSLTREPEAFGRSTLEALTLGTPVVGYAHGATVEILSALFPTGLVAVGAITAAADRLAAIHASRERVPAHERYALATMCSETLAVYARVAAERAAA